MDVDEELVDYQEDEEMMLLEGGRPTGTNNPEDGDAVMLDDEAGSSTLAETDVPMKLADAVIEAGAGGPGEKPNEDDREDGDAEMVTADAADGPEEALVTEMEVPVASTIPEEVPSIKPPPSTDTPFPTTSLPPTLPGSINGHIAPSNIVPPVFSPLNPDPTVPPKGMIISGADVGLAESSIAPSWPPPPDAIPPVPSRLPDAASVPEALATEESKLNVVAGEVGVGGIDVEVASVVAEAPCSPGIKPVDSLPAAAVDEGHADPSIDAAKHSGAAQVAGTSIEAILPGAPPTSDESIVEQTEESTDDADAHAEGVTEDVDYAGEEGEYVEGEEGEEDYYEEGAGGVEGDEGDAIEFDDGEHDSNHLDNPLSPPLGPETITEAADREELNADSFDVSDDVEDPSDSNASVPPIMLAISEEDVRPLFDDGLEETLKESQADEGEAIAAVLPSMGEELYRIPLSELFAALRVALQDEIAEDEGTELVLFEKDLGLRIGEDNRHAESTTICDLVDLHERCNCPEPITFFLERDQARFISKYTAIKQVLDAAEGKSDEAASINGGEGDMETDDSQLATAEHEGEGGEYIGEETYDAAGEEGVLDETDYEEFQGHHHTLDESQESSSGQPGRTEQEAIKADIDADATEVNHVSEARPDDAGIEKSGAQDTDVGTETEESKKLDFPAKSAQDARDLPSSETNGSSESNLSDQFGIEGIIREADADAKLGGHSSRSAAGPERETREDTEDLVDFDGYAGTRTPAKQGNPSTSVTKRALEEPDSPSRQVKRKLSGAEDTLP